MILSTLALYLTLGACAVLIGVMVVQYDLYDREPLHLVLLAVVLGAGMMWAAGQAQVKLIHEFANAGREVGNVTLALMAASTEELAKLSVVAMIALLSRRHFNEPLDGIIYGAFAGLGAALDESIWVLGKSAQLEYLPLQEPIRLSGHLIMGGIGGFGMGLLTIRSKWAPLAIAASLLGAIALHTGWDVVAFNAMDFYRLWGRTLWWHTAAPVAMMLAGIIAFKLMVREGARLTRELMQVCDLRTHECPPERDLPQA